MFQCHCWLAPHHPLDCWVSVLPCCSLIVLHFGRWWLSLRHLFVIIFMKIRLRFLVVLVGQIHIFENVWGIVMDWLFFIRIMWWVWIIIIPILIIIIIINVIVLLLRMVGGIILTVIIGVDEWIVVSIFKKKPIIAMFLTGHSVYPINYLIGHRETCPTSPI